MGQKDASDFTELHEMCFVRLLFGVGCELRCLCRVPGVHQLGVEPEQPAGAGRVRDAPHQRRHLRHEDPLVLRRHVLFVLLLAHRGPLELLHQLHALVRGASCSRISRLVVVLLISLSVIRWRDCEARCCERFCVVCERALSQA